MGDALQESRYQNRLLHMAQDRALREQSVADTVAGALYGAQGQQPAAPPVNMLAPDPQSAAPVPPANGLPQPTQMPGSIYGQMAAVTPPAGPGAAQQGWQPNSRDVRADGSQKGTGWLGVMKRPDGGVSSEISVGVNLDGKETEIPLMIPTLAPDEVKYLLSTPLGPGLTKTPMGQQILQKAVGFAKEQLSKGQSPFAPGSGPAAPQAATPPPPTVNPYDKQRMVLRDLYNSGRVTAAEAQRYDEKITEKEVVWKEQQAKQRMDQLKLMAEEGKIDADKAKLAQSQMEPVVRAMSPLLDKRDKLVAGGMSEKEADAAVQPDYEQMLTSMADIPGFEKAAKSAPRKFSPTMAYALKDTYAALEKVAIAKEKAAAAAQLAADKAEQNVPAELKTFEAANGYGPAQRGTPEYRSALLKWDKDHKTALHVTVGGGSGGAAADSFSKWSKQDKEWWFENMKATGQKPDFGWGKSAGVSRAQFSKEYAQWAQGKGITGQEAGTEKEQFKNDAKSAGFITKQLDASGAFIKTIDNNIDQLEKHIGTMSKSLNLDRNRLLNMGTREFNKKLVGTANINIYDMLVAAISTENAKLQAGGAGSVAQVAEGARAEMARIHDNNLPVSEMIKLMKATRQEGNNRIKALKDQKAEIQQRMRGGSGKPADQRISTAARRIASDLRGNWSDPKRQQMVYENLKKQRYTDEEIGQAFAAAKGGQ